MIEEIDLHPVCNRFNRRVKFDIPSGRAPLLPPSPHAPHRDLRQTLRHGIEHRWFP